MNGLALLVGHLVGDFILQNDWMAKWKSAKPGVLVDSDLQRIPGFHWAFLRPSVACLLHCLLYTLGVWLFAFWWLPAWGLGVVFALHYPVDRFRLARLWMVHVSGQKQFAEGVFSPWSVIVVDQIFHLSVLVAVAAAAGQIP